MAMQRLRAFPKALVLTLIAGSAAAADFTGIWSIDLRTPEQRARNAPCGSAEFTLVQTKDRIEGSHSFATSDCGRVNEGGPDTVKGVVVDGKAILVVTSGRNGEMALGVATLAGDRMYWQVRRELRDGEPAGDSGLILAKGTLIRVKKAASASPNKAVASVRGPPRT